MSLDFRCIIIDDEPKAIELLKRRLQLLFPNVQVVNTYTQWEDAYEAILNTPIDLLFLDVSMPEKTGVDFLKLFPKLPFQVIFVTAHTQFAVEAIKFSASGYVLKPVDDYELSFAVNKALDRARTSKEPPPASKDNFAKIGIPNPKGIDYINADDILYFESVNKYTKVVTMSHSLLSSYNLGEFKKLVEPPFFIQVHRSFIINLRKVKRYETSGNLVMEDDTAIPVSRSVRNEFLQAFNSISRTVGLKTGGKLPDDF